eukprot:358067_1
MISVNQLKQFNYICEQLGFTISWDALYVLNQKYTDYKISGILASANIATFDWHCGVTENKNNDSDTNIDDSNHIIIEIIRYWNRSKCIKIHKPLKDMTYEELLNLSFSHRCKKNTQNERRDLTLPYSDKCKLFREETKTDKILFDINEHPKVQNKPLKEEGFVFCFMLPFNVFLNNMATKYEVDLSKVKIWDLYRSKINPFWAGDNVSKFGALVTMFTKPRKATLIFSSLNIAHESESHVSTDVIMNELETNIEIAPIIESNVISNDLETDIDTTETMMESNAIGNDFNMLDMMHQLAELEVETETTLHTYLSHPPPLGKVKTESIIVDCFRKELIPFIDCTINNNVINNEMQALCQKYFFTKKQLKRHKYELMRMRKKDPLLTYFDNVNLPILNIKTKHGAVNNSNVVKPIQIVQEWIMSFVDDPLECPFTANQMLKWIRNDFDTEQKQDDEFNNCSIDDPIVISVRKYYLDLFFSHKPNATYDPIPFSYPTVYYIAFQHDISVGSHIYKIHSN